MSTGHFRAERAACLGRPSVPLLLYCLAGQIPGHLMAFRVSLFPLKEGTDLWLYLKRQLSSASPKSLLIGIHHCTVYEVSEFRAFFLLASTKSHVHTHLAPCCPSAMQVGVRAQLSSLCPTGWRARPGLFSVPCRLACMLTRGLFSVSCRLDSYSHKEDASAFPGKRALISFLSWFDYCDQLIKEAQKV